jgi:hypothetical protein
VAAGARNGDTGTKAARARGVGGVCEVPPRLNDANGAERDDNGSVAAVGGDCNADSGELVEARAVGGAVAMNCLCLCCCSFSRRIDSAARTAEIEEMVCSLPLMPLLPLALPLLLPLPPVLSTLKLELANPPPPPPPLSLPSLSVSPFDSWFDCCC